jgi:Fe2+ or Zn2+ uptake regulation protein
VALLDVLFDAAGPLTHAEIGRRLEPDRVNRVTLYRTLEVLRGAGIVHRLENPDRVWRFGVCGRTHPGHCHPHFTCRLCGTVECLRDVTLPRPAGLERAYRVEEQELYMRGVCGRCASAGGSKG